MWRLICQSFSTSQRGRGLPGLSLGTNTEVGSISVLSRYIPCQDWQASTSQHCSAPYAHTALLKPVGTPWPINLPLNPSSMPYPWSLPLPHQNRGARPSQHSPPALLKSTGTAGPVILLLSRESYQTRPSNALALCTPTALARPMDTHSSPRGPPLSMPGSGGQGGLYF